MSKEKKKILLKLLSFKKYFERYTAEIVNAIWKVSSLGYFIGKSWMDGKF